MFVVSKRRIGIFGGSFDPPHLGHIAIAGFVASTRKLDEVLFVVANIQWQKVAEREMLDPLHRLEMTKLAVEGIDNFHASSIEIDRGGDSITVETLETLYKNDPEAQYELIIGADIASRLETWRRFEEIEKYAEIVVVGRPGFDSKEIESDFNPVILNGPQLEMSSENIRAAIGLGDSVAHLVPELVDEYIRQEGLYR